LSRRNISNKLSVEFTPGRIIRWRKRRFVVVDCTGFEAIVAREVGKRRLERIPVAEAQPDHSINQRAISVTNLVAVPDDKWQTAVRRFTVLKRLLSDYEGFECWFVIAHVFVFLSGNHCWIYGRTGDRETGSTSK
jgi:hypothetical protein